MILSHKGKKIEKQTFNDFRYIRWSLEADVWLLEKEEWNRLIARLRSNPERWPEVKNVDRQKTLRLVWLDGKWHIDSDELYFAPCYDRYFIFRLKKKQKELKVKTRYKFLDKEETIVPKGMTGMNARVILKEKMQEIKGFKEQKAFGALDLSKEDERELAKAVHNINRCVGPFIGVNQKYLGKVTERVWKADYSSAYPAHGTYKIPDIRQREIVKGRERPTEEWPVCFYLKSGHLAEYGIYDTHIDGFSELYKEYRNPFNRKNKYGEPAVKFKMIDDEDEVTLRMKYSKYDLKEEFDYFYKMKQEKKDREAAKAVLNMSIGTFDFLPRKKKQICWNSGYRYFGHIRAVILARHNHEMIERYREIKGRGMELVSIQTDSMIWTTTDPQIDGRLESTVCALLAKMGDFVEEICNGRVYIAHCGAYFIEDAIVKIIKHQGIENFDESIDSLEGFIDWFKNNKVIIRADEMDEDGYYQLKEV